jgi:hypothetical protein
MMTNNKNNKNNMVINIISYTFLGIIFYLFMWDFKIFQIFQIFIFSIFSFAISMFISDKFKLSNNKFIKILQKCVFINSILALIGLILYLFDISIFNTVYCDSDSESDDENNNEEIIKNKNIKNKDIAQVTSNIDDKNEEYYSFKVKKDVFDNVMDKGKELFMVGVKDIAPNLGIGAAAGKAAAEAFKHTGGMAAAPRIAAVGATAFATAAGTKIGIELGKVAMENKKIENEMDASKLDEIDKEGRNSPSDYDGGFIHSVLEESEIPLITMVNGLCYLNYIEFSLILGLFSLLFRKFLNRKLKRIILNLKNKYIKNKEVESINDENVTLNKAFNTVDKYTDYIIVFIFICLFWVKIINIYFSSNLAENIDSYVKVYNHLINNSFLCLFSIKNEYIVSKNYLCNQKNNNRNFIFPFSFLTEIKFINILILKLKNYSLNTPPIIIGLFTFTISILLAFMDVALLLSSYQITL